MKPNKIKICGRKTSTPPTPATTPSTIRDRSTPSGMTAVRRPLSVPMATSRASISGVAQTKID